MGSACVSVPGLVLVRAQAPSSLPSSEVEHTLTRRTFDMIDIVEILIHWYAGRSQNELATSLGVDRKTLRKYTAPAVAAGLVPGGPPMAEQDWRRLATGWFLLGRHRDRAGRGVPQVSRRASPSGVVVGTGVAGLRPCTA